jgi:hypothetical protein
VPLEKEDGCPARSGKIKKQQTSGVKAHSAFVAFQPI